MELETEYYFTESARVISSLAEENEVILRMAREIFSLSENANKCLIGGNGGSCADAEHFAGELVCTFKDRFRKGISAISLTNNSSAITAWSNDFGFDTFFKRQVESLAKKNDILFLLSTGGGDKTSGASMNLVAAAETAKNMGLKVFSLAGKGGGILKNISDECIVVKSQVTSHIQEAHIAIIHKICLQLDLFDKKSRQNV